MSLWSTQVALDGNVDSLAALCGFGGSAKKGIRQLTVQQAAGNAAFTIGSKADVTAGHGLNVVAGATSVAPVTVAGPFSEASPTTLDEWYIKGTNGNTVEVVLISQ